MSVKKTFFRDVLFSGVSKYSTIIITLLVTSVLARVLTPDDFGVVAIATIFIAFFNLLSDFGIATAIVQFKDLTDKDLNNIFGWTLWLGFLLSSLFYMVSPFIASFYDNIQLVSVCRLLSLQIFFATINIVPNALLFKNKKFNIVAFRTILVQVACGIIAIIAALNGIGIYALLINPILGMFANFLINEMYMKLSLSLFPSFSSINKILSFSVFQFLFNFINYIGNNLDKMIIGKAFSMSGLGYYEKAYRLEQMPAQTINGVVGPVLHPYLSDYQNSPCKIQEIYNKANKFLLSISFPISALCLFCSREMVLIVFGPQWEESITYFSIMSVSVATQLATVHTGAILQSCNRTKLLFVIGTLNVIIALTFLLVGAFVFKSIIAICVCGALSAIICTIITYILTYKYCFDSSPTIVLKYFIRPILFYIVIGALAYFIYDIMTNLPLFVSLLIKVSIWMTITFVFFQYFTPYKPKLYFNRIKTRRFF